jgi:hypothetical protein
VGLDYNPGTSAANKDPQQVAGDKQEADEAFDKGKSTE